MPFITGTGASLQIGKETVFGTGVQPTDLVDITSEGIKLSVEKGDEGSLLASKTPNSRDLMSISVSGSVSFILRASYGWVR
ncbi:MAG: phage tail tube protein [Sphaerochaetaceae bacterium]